MKVNWKDYVDQRFNDNDKLVQSALQSVKEATAKTENERKENKEDSNKWRETLKDRESSFLTRKEFYSMIITAVSVITLVLIFLKYYK